MAGDDLPLDAAPIPPAERNREDYSPFNSDMEFELAEFLYQKAEMSGGNIDILSGLLARLLGPDHGTENPWANHEELYGLIDEIHQGDILWESFTVKYNGELPEDQSSVPAWKLQGYEVWFRDPLKTLEQMLANPNFKSEFDVAPKRLFNNGKRLYRDLMTGNWAWLQCVC